MFLYVVRTYQMVKTSRNSLRNSHSELMDLYQDGFVSRSRLTTVDIWQLTFNNDSICFDPTVPKIVRFLTSVMLHDAQFYNQWNIMFLSVKVKNPNEGTV